jgi:hypothetical protein
MEPACYYCFEPIEQAATLAHRSHGIYPVCYPCAKGKYDPPDYPETDEPDIDDGTD